MLDGREVNALARGLAIAPAKIIPAIIPVAGRAGANIKRTMRKDVSGHPRFSRLPSLVGYDVTATTSSVTVEVGFRDEGQGELANIAAFGTSDTPPIMDINHGVRDELPNFMKWLGKAAADVL